MFGNGAAFICSTCIGGSGDSGAVGICSGVSGSKSSKRRISDVSNTGGWPTAAAAVLISDATLYDDQRAATSPRSRPSTLNFMYCGLRNSVEIACSMRTIHGSNVTCTRRALRCSRLAYVNEVPLTAIPKSDGSTRNMLPAISCAVYALVAKNWAASLEIPVGFHVAPPSKTPGRPRLRRERLRCHTSAMSLRPPGETLVGISITPGMLPSDSK